MENSFIICHYDEIGVKGKNRIFFEKALERNIFNALKEEHSELINNSRILSGRIVINTAKLNIKKRNEIKQILKFIPGLAYFAFGTESSTSIESINNNLLSSILGKRFNSFRITTMRSDKSYPLNSQKINEEVGAYIVSKTNKKVKLKKPGLNCFIEIVNGRAFLYFDKIKGEGGLPVGTAGKTAILMSGGIDSPVAAYYLMRRGSNPIFIHFHSLPFTSNQSVDKVKELVLKLKKFGSKGKIYLVPFAETQKQILVNCPDKLRIILYRRFMMRIAKKIATKEKCLALVTGESLGQVASQTMENMFATDSAVNFPVFRPLIGMDKKAIIEKAKEIDTYNISIQPHDDCCVRFMPKKPETRAKMPEVKLAEKSLSVQKIVSDSIKNAETIIC